MHRSTRMLTSLVICTTPLLLGAAKPRPAPAPFVPAIAYKYGPEELRLSNADGSQAVLLVRKPRGESILYLSLARLDKQSVAYIEGTNAGTVRSLRVATWVPQAAGGLAVNIDPQAMMSSTNGGMALASVDFSPDGTRLAVLSTDFDAAKSELRFFDVATRRQVGETIALSKIASTLSWRSYDNSILLRGIDGMSSFKDDIETDLFGGNQPTDFDTFNGSSPDVILPYSGTAPGGTTQRWDGLTISSGGPAITKLVDGLGTSVSCDNAKMIYTDFAAKRASYNLIIATGARVLFSKDSLIQKMEYPNACS